MLRKQDNSEENLYLTAEGIERLKRTLKELESQRPKIVEDLTFAISLGDLSENAEYQDAKHRLSKTDGRIFSIKDRLKNVIRINEQPTTTGHVRLGSNVVLAVAGKQKGYQIVGPQEANPSRGRISLLSPLGAALIGHGVGETITVETPGGQMDYGIVEVT